MSDELLELAARCEAVTRANYALEVDIFKAIQPDYADYVEGRGGLVHPYDGSDMRVLSDVRPGNYTASLDAAMTLVPDAKWYWSIKHCPHAKCVADIGGIHTGVGATPALALTAAALRVRAARLRMEVE